MLLWCPRVNQCVIYEQHHKFIQIRFDDSIHRVHECSWGIRKPKTHHYVLVVFVSSVEGHFGYVILLDTELIVVKLKIHLRKVPAPFN